MDLEKIGRFISNHRKKKNMTQMELAERLNITDRAVSKWERGKSMPDSSVMLSLCEVLGFSVNELLSGEEVKVEDYNKQAEKNLLEITRQKEQSDKLLLTIEIIMMALSISLFLALHYITFFVCVDLYLKILLGAISFLQLISVAVVAFRIEQKAGYYECQHCHHRFVPTLNQSLFSMHCGWTKYMKCPKCGQKSWSKKVISKENE